MWTTVGLTVLSTLVVCCLAYVGLHVGLHPQESTRKHLIFKGGFWLCTLFACVLTGAVAWRGEQSAAALSKQISDVKQIASVPHPAYAVLKFDVLPAKTPSRDGRMVFQFTLHNVSSVGTGPISAWLRLCDECIWGDNPDWEDDPQEERNHSVQWDYLVPGAHTAVVTANLVVPHKSFALCLAYSCQYCSGDSGCFISTSFPPFLGDVSPVH
jgi:hypothetical protein